MYAFNYNNKKITPSKDEKIWLKNLDTKVFKFWLSF